jgi:hypothetical protein
MDNRSPSMLKPTLIGGAVFGLVGALPLIGALNCACCALVMAGGFLAAYLYSRDCASQGFEFRAGGGAMVGLVAGLFYALTTTIVSGIVNMVTGASMEQILEQAEEMGADIPPEAEPFIQFLTETNMLVLALLGFFFWLLIAAIFSTIGGLIGGAAFKVEPKAPAPPSAGMSTGGGPEGGAPPI